jgi:glycogen operon protein
MRNILASLLWAQGTPMILGGDEFHRTQRGNNNAYCQDNDISWVDWSLAEAHKPTVDFVRNSISLRNRYPVLRRNRFLTGAYDEALGVKDVTWIHPSGSEMSQEAWNDGAQRSVGMLIDGRSQPTGVHERGSDATLLLIFNSHHEAVNFVMPAAVEGEGWRLHLTTSDSPAADRMLRPGETVEIADRSVSLFSMS